jgi:exosome complex component RRP46
MSLPRTFARYSLSLVLQVYGPQEVKPRQELLDKALLEVLVKPVVRTPLNLLQLTLAQTGLPSYIQKEQEYHIRAALESIIISTLHPRTGIQVILQVVADEGGVSAAVIICPDRTSTLQLFATLLNAAVCALMDAGIPLNSMLAAVNLCIPTQGRAVRRSLRIHVL